MVRSEISCPASGLRIFPIKLLSVNLEVNDYMVPRVVVHNPKSDKAGATVQDSSTFSQNPTFIVGVSFFFPDAGRGE